MSFDRGFRVAGWMFAVWGLICLGITGGMIYAICHFIAKFW